jgi:hypothetical protein
MSIYRVAQILTFVSTLAITFSAFLASAAYACGVNGGGGGYC